jgi:hypothetical protein
MNSGRWARSAGIGFSLLSLVAFVVTTIVPAASGNTAGSAPLHLALPWHGADAPCPAGYSATTECHPRTSGSVPVPGLGFVSESYVFAFENANPVCPRGFGQSLRYPARLTVKGRGDILLTVEGTDRCAEVGTTALLDLPQAFTVSGGSGTFAGASGTGVVTRSDTGLGVHGFGTDNWEGTLTAPDFELDLTPPVIKVANKVVTAPLGTRSVRVRYRVTSPDEQPCAARLRTRARTRPRRPFRSPFARRASSKAALASFRGHRARRIAAFPRPLSGPA